MNILKGHFEIKYSDHQELKEKIKYLEVERGTISKEIPIEEERKNSGFKSKFEDLQNKYQEIQKKITEKKNKLSQIYFRRTAMHYKIKNRDYFFYVQDLISKSLLYDSGIGGGGTSPFEILSITDFGERFINFIEE